VKFLLGIAEDSWMIGPELDHPPQGWRSPNRWKPENKNHSPGIVVRLRMKRRYTKVCFVIGTIGRGTGKPFMQHKREPGRFLSGNLVCCGLLPIWKG